MYSSQSLKVMPKRTSSELATTYKLSKEQLQFYEKNGYLVIQNLIDFTTLYTCKQRFARICKGIESFSGLLVKEPSLVSKGLTGENLYTKVQEILYDEVFQVYTEHPRLLDVISQLIGDDLTAMHSMLINKPPGSSRHPPHQDLFYFPFRPADKIAASWTAIDEVTIENGALFLVPGSHKQEELYPHGDVADSNRLYHGILDEERVCPISSRVHFEMNPGDTIFFHPLVVHGSEPNITQRYRKAITVHYANSSCHYIDLAGTVQEKVANDFEGQFKKMGLKINYKDTWKIKSKQVKGVRSNL